MPKQSADEQPDAQPTNRRINRHKTAEVINIFPSMGSYPWKHYGAPQIAAELGLSRVKVDRLFASAIGRSVGEEILRQRIGKARRLLADTDWPLEAIAAETGFCHASYFVKVFRKATGSTPHNWRKLNSERHPADGRLISNGSSRIG